MNKLLLPVLLLGIYSTINAQVGIGTNSPNSSSILDVNVNNLPANGKKGLLIPQVALSGAADVATIPNPANGLMVFNTTDAGTSPNNVKKDTFYKYNMTKAKWELIADESSLAALNIPTVGSVLGFTAKPTSGGDPLATTYLGSDLSASIRQVLFDKVRLQSSSCSYSTTTGEFTANKSGYFNFQLNLVVKGPYNNVARLGVSKPYTGTKPTTASNNTFAFLSQNSYVNIDGSTPVPMSVNGLLFMNAGEKVIFLTRFIDPATNTLDVESINYDRTLVNSVSVTYFGN